MAKTKNKRYKTRAVDPLILGESELQFEDLGSQQQEAVYRIEKWFKSEKTNKKELVYRLGGLAGTGKSALIKYLIDRWGFDSLDCYVVAYTGQAVNVLRQRGIMAKTIHSTFMKVTDVPVFDEYGNVVVRSGVPVTRVKFTPLKRIPSTVKLVICDEASFLPKKLQDQILRYNVPLLEIGDPVQLPPVAGDQCFNLGNVDFFIEEIMRQEADSEIVQLAHAIRNHEPIDPRRYGKDVTFLIAQPTIESTFWRFKPFIQGADMIITTLNKERTELTNLYRSHVIKTDSPFPVKGERMICRKNDWNLSIGPYPLTNGTQGRVLHKVGMSDADDKMYFMDFQPSFVSDDYFDNLMCDTKFLKKPFGADEEEFDKKNMYKKFEYAHVITAHLAQGAQFPNVVFFDHFLPSKDDYHMRVRYTAVTRAQNRLVWIIPYFERSPGWTDLWRGGFKP